MESSISCSIPVVVAKQSAKPLPAAHLPFHLTPSTSDPNSGSISLFSGPKTETCEDVRGIENILVGRCIQCGTLFCTDCGQVFKNDVVTISSPACPACGSSNTDFPADEDDDSEALREVVACHDCGGSYCFACGKPLLEEEEEEAGGGSRE